MDPETFARVQEHLPHDAYRDFARFGYGSAWRKAEMATLTWDHVDRKAGVITLAAEHSKTGEQREVPLVGTLAENIARRWKAREYQTADDATALADHVFHVKGRPIGDFRKAWKNAAKAAGVPGLLFHDLRRSAIRNLDKAGVSQVVAMKISGHKSASVWRRYRIVDLGDVADALKKADAFTAAPAVSVVVDLKGRKARGKRGRR